MASAGIIYDRTTIDLGPSGVVGAQPGRAADVHRSLGGTAQCVVERTYETLLLTQSWGKDYTGAGAGTTLYRALMTFWNCWGIHGRPFAFTHDTTKLFDSVLTADPLLGNRLVNGDLEAWTSATAPEDVTASISGSTTINREGRREHVYEGLYAGRWDVAGGAQSTMAFLTDVSFPASTPFGVRFRQKFSADGKKLQVAIQNVDSTEYAQDNTPTWGGTIHWFDASTVTGLDWAGFSQDFAGGPDDPGVLKLLVRNSASADACWIDSVELRRTAGTLAIRNRTGLAAADTIRLISRTESREEILVVSSLTSPSDLTSDLTLAALPRGRFDDRDIVRGLDYYPYLVADQDDPAVFEEEAGVYRLKLKCRDALTGRV